VLEGKPGAEHCNTPSASARTGSGRGSPHTRWGSRCAPNHQLPGREGGDAPFLGLFGGRDSLCAATVALYAGDASASRGATQDEFVLGACYGHSLGQAVVPCQITGMLTSLHCRTPQVCSTMATSAVAQVAPLLRCNPAVGLNRRRAAGHSTRQPPQSALVAVPRNCVPLARRTALSATSRRCVPVVCSSASVAASPDQVRGCQKRLSDPASALTATL